MPLRLSTSPIITMPYNTRRKSLCLPALGIQLPSTSRAYRPPVSRPSNETEPQIQHPAKRVKRSHTEISSSPISPSRSPPPTASVTCKTVTFAERPDDRRRNAYEHTPPPSPGEGTEKMVDLESINDDIVIAVVQQLEKTGNRPHLIKELASVLSNTNGSVKGSVITFAFDFDMMTDTRVHRSANPAALISSRLASYMHRTWTALSPCPLAKELIPVHPRKVFYYLTTSPRQEMPSSDSDILPPIVGGGRGKSSPKRIISPSLSNASQDDDPCALEDRKRAALSPSPEIDLSFDLDETVYSAISDRAPDFPSPPATTPTSFQTSRSSMGREGSDPDRDLGLNRRAESPPLEGDEREFTATARGMRLRGMSVDDINRIDGKSGATKMEGKMDLTETEEEKAKRNSEAAETLFGGHHRHHSHSQPEQGNMILSSPMVKPVAVAMGMNSIIGHNAGDAKDARVKTGDMDLAMEGTSILGESVFGLGWEISRPENVDLDELDDLLDGC